MRRTLQRQRAAITQHPQARRRWQESNPTLTKWTFFLRESDKEVSCSGESSSWLLPVFTCAQHFATFFHRTIDLVLASGASGAQQEPR